MENEDTNKPAALLGKKGGQVKSERKTITARANGKLGGRPRKKNVETTDGKDDQKQKDEQE